MYCNINIYLIFILSLSRLSYGIEYHIFVMHVSQAIALRLTKKEGFKHELLHYYATSDS